MTGKEKEGTKTKTTAKSASNTSSNFKSTKTRSNSNLDFTEDPFRDYRYEDPFNIGDPFDDVTDNQTSARDNNNKTSLNNDWEERKKVDPFGMEVPSTNTNTNGKATPLPGPLPSEEQQLAWASAESMRMEEERRTETMREIADLQLALTLSKKDKPRNKATNAFKRILS